MRKIIILILFALLIFPSTGEKNRIKDLPLKYQKWLNLVWWVITPKEKEVFLQIKNNKDRDIFIKTFWKVRDPNPSTPKNEFREELIRRFNYANKYLGTDSPRPGWMSDRGKIYILLGPPISKERYYMNQYVVPTEVWYYYGRSDWGLPSHFAMIFFKRNGIGEFKLYDPLGDGPYELLIKNQDTRNLSPTNYEKIYEYIRNSEPTLAEISLSLIPGQIPYDYQPSLNAASIISRVLTIPEKEFDTTYAKDFLKYRGLVSVDYTLNYINSRFSLHIAKDMMFGKNFLHYTIEPSSISLEKINGKNVANFEVTSSLKKENGDTIFQYRNNFNIKLRGNELRAIKSGGISLQGEFPVIEGKYEVILLVKNTISKEFSYIDTRIDVPPPDEFHIEKPVIAFGKKQVSLFALKPFTFGNNFLLTDSRNTFSQKEKPTILIRICSIPKQVWENQYLEVRASSEEKDFLLKKIKLSSMPYKTDMEFLFTSNVKLPSDEYEVYVKIGKVKSPEADIAISPLSSIPRPLISSSVMPLKNQFLIYLSLGSQYSRAGKLGEAVKYLKKSLLQRPNCKDAVLLLAQDYLILKKPEKALTVLSKIGEKGEYEILFYKGKANEEMGNFKKAISYYKRSISIYDSDPRVLNSLGICYLKLGRKDEAKKAFEASLRLNSGQEKVKKILKNLL